MRHRHLRRCHEPPEIDVTAFMNLMVVLIPFLLLSAAFNHLTMFELYLPTSGSVQETADAKLPELSVELRTGELSLYLDGKRNARLADLENGAADIAGLRTELRTLKNRYPTLTAISLLAEPEIPYARIIAVMDGVRAMRIDEAGKQYRLELFPDVALGDAVTGKGR